MSACAAFPVARRYPVAYLLPFGLFTFTLMDARIDSHQLSARQTCYRLIKFATSWTIRLTLSSCRSWQKNVSSCLGRQIIGGIYALAIPGGVIGTGLDCFLFSYSRPPLSSPTEGRAWWHLRGCLISMPGTGTHADRIHVQNNEEAWSVRKSRSSLDRKPRNDHSNHCRNGQPPAFNCCFEPEPRSDGETAVMELRRRRESPCH